MMMYLCWLVFGLENEKKTKQYLSNHANQEIALTNLAIDHFLIVFEDFSRMDELLVAHGVFFLCFDLLF